MLTAHSFLPLSYVIAHLICGRNASQSFPSMFRLAVGTKSCTPDNNRRVGETGFCAATEDLDDRCGELEIAASQKDCRAFDGAWCCYVPLRLRPSFTKQGDSAAKPQRSSLSALLNRQTVAAQPVTDCSNDTQYQSIISNISASLTQILTSATNNPNAKPDNSSGFYLGLVILTAETFKINFDIFQGKNVSGQQCLDANANLASVYAQILALAGDNTAAGSSAYYGQLYGEDLYRSYLLQLVSATAATGTIADKCGNATTPSPNLSVVLSNQQALDKLLLAISTNDTGTCVDAAKQFGSVLNALTNPSVVNSVSTQATTVNPSSQATTTNTPTSTVSCNDDNQIGALQSKVVAGLQQILQIATSNPSAKTDNSSGYYLGLIIRAAGPYKTNFDISQGKNVSGDQCLQANANLTSLVLTLVNAGSGTSSVSPANDQESQYRTILTQFAAAVTSSQVAIDQCANTTNPSSTLSAFLSGGKANNQLTLAVVSNNATACFTAAQTLGQFLSSIVSPDAINSVPTQPTNTATSSISSVRIVDKKGHKLAMTLFKKQAISPSAPVSNCNDEGQLQAIGNNVSTALNQILTTAQNNPNAKTDNSSGFYLGLIVLAAQTYKINYDIFKGKTVSGAQCLDANANLTKVFGQLSGLANDTIQSNGYGQLYGDDLYHSYLLQLVSSTAASFAVVDQCANAINASQTLSLFLSNNQAYSTLLLAVATNDSSTCIAAATQLGSVLDFITSPEVINSVSTQGTTTPSGPTTTATPAPPINCDDESSFATLATNIGSAIGQLIQAANNNPTAKPDNSSGFYLGLTIKAAATYKTDYDISQGKNVTGDQCLQANANLTSLLLSFASIASDNSSVDTLSSQDKQYRDILIQLTTITASALQISSQCGNKTNPSASLSAILGNVQGYSQILLAVTNNDADACFSAATKIGKGLSALLPSVTIDNAATLPSATRLSHFAVSREKLGKSNLFQKMFFLLWNRKHENNLHDILTRNN